MLSPQKLFLLLATFIGLTNAWFGTVAYSDNTEDQVWGEQYDECRALPPDKQPISIYIGDTPSDITRVYLYSENDCSPSSYVRTVRINKLNDIAPEEVVGAFKVTIPCRGTSGPCTVPPLPPYP